MADKPDSPFRLTRSRIILLILIVVAVASILGAITGGLSGYQQLRAAATSSQP